MISLKYCYDFFSANVTRARKYFLKSRFNYTYERAYFFAFGGFEQTKNDNGDAQLGKNKILVISA